MIDRVRALELAGRLVVAFPGRNVTDAHANAWADVLERLDDAEAQAVVERLRGRSVDPPSVAQVHQAVAEVQEATYSPRLRLVEDVPEADFVGFVKLARSEHPICRECGVPHITRTHDKHVERALAAARRFRVTKVGRKVTT